MEDPDALGRGRDSYVLRSWGAAFEFLSRADATSLLSGDDLELLARAAYMLGRDDDYVAVLERAFQAHVTADDPARGALCGFWIGLNLMPRGEVARAGGWFGRAERLLERDDLDCAARGYLMIPALLGCVGRGDCAGAHSIACAAAEIAERFDDRDLLALVVMEQGHALVRLGRFDEGFRLVDEVLVSVTTRELSPVVTGIVYCNTITFCASVFELSRAKEWTADLTRWCDQQPDMAAHTGLCMVHRAEIMELQGAWEDALAEAKRAGERAERGVLNQGAAGHAFYREGEVYRRQGRFDPADAAYEQAALRGREPQPGLALLRVAQGRVAAAVAAIRRVEVEAVEPLDRARVLPAFVEIMLAAGEVQAARPASEELAAIAARRRSSLLEAIADHASGAVAVADGDPAGALLVLRRSWQVWRAFDAPYESARIRVLVGLACRALGDEDTALLELRLARDAFAALSARPDVSRVDDLMRTSGDAGGGGLTARELQVLRRLARGATNKAIGDELAISERTVDRHVSNIFTKAGVASRAAATAYAFEHQLV